MNSKPNLHTHIIGFPFNSNSNNNDNYDNIKKENNDILDTSIYKPLYELSNGYLRNGYSILYSAESLSNERDKAKILEDMRNVDTNNTKQIQSNISKGLVTIINSDTIYKEDVSGGDIVDFLLSNISNMQQKSQGKTIHSSSPGYKK